MCNQRHEQFSSTVLITFSPAETFCLDTVERGRGVVEGGGWRGIGYTKLSANSILIFFCLPVPPLFNCLFVCFVSSPHVLYVLYSQSSKVPFLSPPSLALSAFRSVDLFCYLVASCFLFTVCFDLIWILILIPLLILIQFQKIFICLSPFWFRFGFGFEFIFLLSSRYSSRWCKFPFDYVYKSIWLMRSQLGTNFVALQFLLCLLLLSSLKNNKLFKFSQRDKISGFIEA